MNTLKVILGLYGAFALFMLLRCVYAHKSPKERLAWVVFFLFLWPVAALMYFLAEALPEYRNARSRERP